MFDTNEAVTLKGVIETVMFAEGAPEAMQAYTVRLLDGQKIHTNVKNLAGREAEPVEIAPDLVPTAFHGRHEAEPRIAPKPRKSRAPHNAKLPREGGL